MKTKIYWLSVLILISTILLFPTCRTSDLRPLVMKKNGVSQSDISKGKEILKEALDSIHIENWLKYPSYSLEMIDTWEKQMGMSLSPWPGENGASLKFSAALNTFDCRV
ncbi:MAG: hypothetical protein ACRC3B_12635, partial [Bacteroidia bacterium]